MTCGSPYERARAKLLAGWHNRALGLKAAVFGFARSQSPLLSSLSMSKRSVWSCCMSASMTAINGAIKLSAPSTTAVDKPRRLKR